MNIRSALMFAAAFVVAGTLQTAQAQEHPTHAEQPAKTANPATAGDIVAVASSAGNFNTFVTAIKAAGLAENLQGEGPFTVFAPTDEAFAKLPANMLADLLKPANKVQLVAILSGHVVSGKIIMAADIKTMKVKSIDGPELNLTADKGVVMVDDAKVVKADIKATNGVIHAIDTVIVPAAPAGPAENAKPKDHPGH